MATTKLTLSVDPEVIAKARRISKLRKTSVSAMFSRYIAILGGEQTEGNSLAADDQARSGARGRNRPGAGELGLSR